MTTQTDGLPALEAQLVQEFVQKGHYDLDGVKELLANHPSLLSAAHDWGGGDWETALGAAGHMGRRDIALHLIGQGAPVDLFAAAMLGNLEIVRAMVEQYPYLRTANGPHGISLIAHAEAGGDDAKEVLAYLSS